MRLKHKSEGAECPLYHISSAQIAADIGEVRQLFRVYADELDVDLCFQDFATELATLPGKYAPPEGALLLARDAEGKAAGCAALRPLSGNTCEMKRLYVLPEHRHTGLGRRLAEEIMDTARACSYSQICLDSLPSMHAAIQLYRKLGFEDIAPYYDTPVKGTVFLGKSLVS